MDLWTVVGGVALIIGIVAGIVQVLDYLEKRRAKSRLVSVEVATTSPPSLAMPSNLPPRGEFIGREREKARVREALASRWPLTCIDGIGGIGKTALALEVAGECLQASRGEVPADGIPTFDGFIWTTAKDRELTLNDMLDAIARTLDYPGIAQKPLEEKQESVHKLLQTKPYLLIVDNFETVKDDAVQDFLLRLPEPSKALITSREQKLRQAWAVSLKGLEQAEALTLIRSEGRRLGLAAVEKAEERVLLRLYQATGGAPLAIKWAVGQIKQKGQSLDSVLAALHEAKGDIFEEVFARSWSLLSDDARRILMVMPIFAASASRAAIEAASDVHHYALDEGLGQLVEMWLVEATDELDAAKRRYSIHPLTRAFAGAKLVTDMELQKDARSRLAMYLTEYVDKLGGPTRRWENYDALELELENVLALMDWCYARGSKETRTGIELWQMISACSEAMADFLWARGYLSELLTLSKRAVEVCRQIGDWEGVGKQACRLGWVYCRREDQDQIELGGEWAKASLEAMQHTNDPNNVAFSKQLLGAFATSKQDFEQADAFLREGLGATTRTRGLGSSASIMIDLGRLSLAQVDYLSVQSWFSEALAYAQAHEDLEDCGVALSYLGDAEWQLGNSAKAEKCYSDGLAVGQTVGRLSTIARCKRGLGQVMELKGSIAQALGFAREALEMFERLDRRQEVAKTWALVERLEGKLSAEE